MPTIIAIFSGVMLAALGGYVAAHGGFVSAYIAGGLMIAVMGFFAPKFSLGVLIFSMLLSPEINLGGLTPGRNVVIRYDDILIVIIFFSWLARTALMKGKPFIFASPLQAPMLSYAFLCIVSTAFGVIRGDVMFDVSFFYVLKYVQYFLLYFMAVNIIETREDVKRYLYLFAAVSVIVTIYAYYYYSVSGPMARATGPFEAPIGNPEQSEPASLGGYYILIFGFLLAALSKASGKLLIAASGLMAMIIPAFLLTFSRASYIGAAFMGLATFLIAGNRRLPLAAVMAAGLGALTLIPGLVDKVQRRVEMTYSGAYAVNQYQLAGQSVNLEGSAAARLESLGNVIFEKLPKHPFIGWGVSGIGIGDTQYALVLGELGVIGMGLFLWMIYRVFMLARSVMRSSRDEWEKCLSIGVGLSLAGLLLQSVGVNSFIIVRIMEPFWFLVAMLAVLHRESQPETAKGK